MTSIFVKLRLARKSSDLKLGYFTSLTIIAERNNSSTGSAKRSLLSEKPFSSIHNKNNVSEATSPAAAGIGKPRNSLLLALLFIAARQLNRASRNAPQIK